MEKCPGLKKMYKKSFEKLTFQKGTVLLCSMKTVSTLNLQFLKVGNYIFSWSLYGCFLSA